MRKFFLLVIFICFSHNANSQSENQGGYEYALIEAARQKSLGNVNEAVKLYLKCLEAKENSSVAAYELGSLYAAGNQLDLSEKYLKKAYELDPQNYWYLLAYVEILKINKKYEEEEKLLKYYLKKNQDNKLEYSLALIYIERGKDRKALKSLNQIETNNGISEIIILKKVELYKKQKEYLKAEKELLKLIYLMPESPEYKVVMAEFLNEIGEKEKAADFFMQALTIDSTNIYAITSLAEFYTNKNDVASSLKYLEKALYNPQIKLENKLKTVIYYIENTELSKNYRKEIENLVIALINTYPGNLDVLALEYDFYSRQKEFEKAYQIIKEMLGIKQDNLVMWQQAIFTASMLNRYDEIIELADKASLIFPNKKEIYLFKAIACYQKSQFQEAYDLLTKNYDVGMDLGLQIQYLVFLGESSYKIGKTTEAFAYFEEVILLDRSNLSVMNNYSYYLSIEKLRLERALELSLKTIQAEPENPVYLDTYGWILFQMEDYSTAEAYLEKAVSRTVDPDLYFHYAEVLSKLKKFEKACNFYRKAESAGFNADTLKEKMMQCE